MAMSLAPLTRSFGVEVSGLDLRDGVEADDASRLRQIFEEDGLLLFRNVDFSAEQQRRWGEMFGDVRVRPGIPTATPVREEGTQYISNSRDDGILGNGELTFHQDHLYLPAVWVADWSIAGFDGIAPEAGAALIAAIWEQAAAVEEYRHEWRVGDLLLWNNLLAQHARLPFNTAEPRTLRRTPIL
jgi:alpha-ketoglutarate-dependent taurine dioxygenase